MTDDAQTPEEGAEEVGRTPGIRKVGMPRAGILSDRRRRGAVPTGLPAVGTLGGYVIADHVAGSTEYSTHDQDDNGGSDAPPQEGVHEATNSETVIPR